MVVSGDVFIINIFARFSSCPWVTSAPAVFHSLVCLCPSVLCGDATVLLLLLLYSTVFGQEDILLTSHIENDTKVCTTEIPRT